MQNRDLAERIVHRYELLDRLGQGAMGIVYRAKDHLTGELVALKRVLAGAKDPLADSQTGSTSVSLTLAREFQTLASLRHPNVISVLDYGFDADRQPFFTMTLLENHQDIRQAARGLSVEQKVGLLIEMLQALAYLHQHNIIHRDLKPGNVLVDENGRLQVLDFGLAVVHGQVQETVGSLSYMAPEVLQELETGHTADLYAVGVIGYELLAGKHPFDTGDLSQLIQGVLHRRPDLIEIPSTIAPVIGRLLEKEPAKRYSQATAAIEALCQAIRRPVPQESRAIREGYLQAARFVGREADLDLLTNALQAAMKRRGSVWLVGGESGVGKTRLLDELRIYALVHGVTVLRGQSSEGGGLPYHLWRDSIRPLLLSTDLNDLEAGILKEIVPDIATLLGRDISDAPPLESAAMQQRLVLTLVDLIKRQNRPLLLILEDLHWATESLQPLKKLISLAAGRPFLVVGSYRDDERPELLDELPGTHPIRLERLREAEIVALSESMLGEVGRSPQVVELLKRETEGNAYFLVEVVRALAEEAGRLSEIGRISLPDRVFAGGVQTIIRRRLERVPDWGRPFLKLAALAGRQVDMRVLANALKRQSIIFQRPQSLLDEWLLVCANAAILELRNRQWEFAHDKLRQAVLAEVNDEERGSLHQRIAEAIEDTHSGNISYAGVLADHWRAAGNSEKEAHYVLLAGAYAQSTGLYQEADACFERALALLPAGENGRRAHLFVKLGENAEALSDFERAKQQLQIGLQLAGENSLLKIEALNTLSTVVRRQGNISLAQQHGEEALQLARANGDRRSLALCLTNLGVAFESRSAYESAQLCYDESLSIMRELGDRQGIAENLNNLGGIWYYLGEYAKSRSCLLEALTIRWELGNRRAVATSLNDLGLVAWMLEKFDEAQWYYEESLSLSQETGERRAIALTLNNLGDVARAQGRYADAERYHQESLQIKREIGHRSGEANSLNDLGMVAFQQGNYETAKQHFVQSLLIRWELQERRGIVGSYINLGHVARVTGDEPEATQLYQDALLQATEVGLPAMLLEVLVGLAGLRVNAGEVETAVRWLGLVLNHPASHFDVRRMTRPILAQVAEKMSAAQIETVLAEGKTMTLNEVVVDLLD